MGMTLRQLIDGLAGARLIGDGEVGVRAVRDDSRKVEPGDVFVAVRGMRSDGHAFVQTAIERGAIAVVVERELEAAKARMSSRPQRRGSKQGNAARRYHRS
jgi:UDP-N-acetylmuramyl pentapeptide synthase